MPVPPTDPARTVFSLILNSITSLLGDNLSKVHLVAHRIVHGGTHTSPVTIRPGQVSEKEAMLVEMDQISSFAPLHVGRLALNLVGVAAVISDQCQSISSTELSLDAHCQINPPISSSSNIRAHL